jgi:hypothetical protein
MAVGLESPGIAVSVKFVGRDANNKTKKPRMFTDHRLHGPD